MKPSVVVVLFCRNRSRYLGDALRSIAAQSIGPVDVILSDNSSEPGEADRCAVLLDQTMGLGRRFYWRQSGAMTMCGHILSVLKQISRDYEFVAIHNDDDIWMPDHLRLSMDRLVRNGGRDLCLSNGIVIDGEGKETGATTNPVDFQLPPTRAKCIDFWLTSWFGNLPSIVMRREVAASIPLIENQHIDTWMVLWTLLTTRGIACIPAPTYYYRSHAGSITQYGKSMIMDRHRLRRWIGVHHGLRFVAACPAFALKFIKSCLYLTGRGRAGS